MHEIQSEQRIGNGNFAEDRYYTSQWKDLKENNAIYYYLLWSVFLTHNLGFNGTYI